MGQTSPWEAAQAAASILHLAQASQSNAAKASATLAMFPKLWFCLLVWSLTGLAVLHLGRSSAAKNLDLDRLHPNLNAGSGGTGQEDGKQGLLDGFHGFCS